MSEKDEKTGKEEAAQDAEKTNEAAQPPDPEPPVDVEPLDTDTGDEWGEGNMHGESGSGAGSGEAGIDLSGYDNDFNEVPDPTDDDLAGGGFDSVPDGKYQVRVDSLRVSRSQNTDLPLLKWESTIIGTGPSAGRKVFRNNLFESPQNMEWLKKDLGRCGIRLEKLSDLPNRVGELIGAILDVQVKTTTKNGETYQNVYLNRLVSRADENTGETAAVTEQLDKDTNAVF